MTMMTDKQAYAAMFYFLEQFHLRSAPVDIGLLLGDMSVLADGEPADGAITQEWHEAVRFALRGGEPGQLVLKPIR